MVFTQDELKGALFEFMQGSEVQLSPYEKKWMIYFADYVQQQKPHNSLPIEDTTILSPNEVINLYRKAYREGYLTPSMFLEKLNELVKEKLKIK
jgi:hypothetical protein